MPVVLPAPRFTNWAAAKALLALRAEAEITNATGSQWLPVRSLFVGTGSYALGEDAGFPHEKVIRRRSTPRYPNSSRRIANHRRAW